MKRPIRILLIGLCAFLSSCLDQGHSETTKLGLGPERPFRFEVKDVSELTVDKFDPNTGDRWYTTLSRKGAKELSEWEFTSVPEGYAELDKKANRSFVLHLLDSLRDLKIRANNLHGSLDSFGLDPPRFAIRWKTHYSQYELRVGTPLKKGSECYITLDGKEVATATGSAIQLLGLIQNFGYLRDTTWTSFSADDVDEIRIFSHKKSVFYAQREGDQWTNKKHQPIQADVQKTLNQITAARIQSFVEPSLQGDHLKNQVESDPLYTFEISDRFGSTHSLKLKFYKNQLYGVSSARPKTTFVLRPQLISYLELRG